LYRICFRYPLSNFFFGFQSIESVQKHRSSSQAQRDRGHNFRRIP
jgi:hypothetical protein